MAKNDEHDSQPNTAIVQTESFSAIETRANLETSATAMAAHARAMVEAKCVLAERHPRSLLQVRNEILADCKRPRFAETARYKKPQGRKQDANGRWVDNHVTGFSIRFAEAMLRAMRNMGATSQVVYEDDEKQIVCVTVMDYQANTSVDASFTIQKRIEKSFLKEGQVPLSRRKNSKGKDVFLVEATDDEIRQMQARLVSMYMRTTILRMVPADIKEEAEEQIDATMKATIKEDPMRELKRVMDAFARLHVNPDNIAKYLGHELDVVTPDEIDELRGVFQAISEEGLNWHEIMALKHGEEPEDEAGKAERAKAEELLQKAKGDAAEKKAQAEDKKAQQAAQQQQQATPPKSDAKPKPPAQQHPPAQRQQGSQEPQKQTSFTDAEDFDRSK